MKTAEQWWGESLPQAFTEVESKFRSGDEIIEWVKQIQLDAWKKGMTDASGMIATHSGARDAICACRDAADKVPSE